MWHGKFGDIIEFWRFSVMKRRDGVLVPGVLWQVGIVALRYCGITVNGGVTVLWRYGFVASRRVLASQSCGFIELNRMRFNDRRMNSQISNMTK